MDPKLTREILNMDKEVLQNALEALGKRDRDTIQALTLELEQAIKLRRNRKVMFGYWSALELLAKLGIFLSENGVVK